MASTRAGCIADSPGRDGAVRAPGKALYLNRGIGSARMVKAPVARDSLLAGNGRLRRNVHRDRVRRGRMRAIQKKCQANICFHREEVILTPCGCCC
jgi:hypothetical protein